MAPSEEKMNYRFGDFSYRFTQEAAEFYKTAGYPKDMAEKMVGNKFGMKIVDMAMDKDGKEGKPKICCHFNIEGFPEYSTCYIALEGQKNMINFPLFGGRVMYTFKKTDKGYDSEFESKMMGTWKIKEEFTEDGIKWITSKDGKAFNEKWKRHMHVDGLYKCTKKEKVEEFFKKLNYPDQFINGLDRYKFAFKSWEQGMKMTEWWGEFSMSTECKYDEEAEYKFPLDKEPFPNGSQMYIAPSKYVFSKTGNGKYTWIMKDNEGRNTEWKFTFNGYKVMVHGTNSNTNDTCYFECTKEYLPIMGNWRSSTVSGAKDLYMTLGFPKEQAQKWADEKIELYVEEKGPITHWTWKSKYNPVEMSFKFDEQFEFFDAYLKEKVKCVASKNNKRMKMLTHSSHGCWETKVTAGDDFMVCKTWLQGLESMPITYMFTRQSYRMPLSWRLGNQKLGGEEDHRAYH